MADEAKERRALRLVAMTFFLLAAYVTFEGIRSLIEGEAPESSPVAIVLLAAANCEGRFRLCNHPRTP